MISVYSVLADAILVAHFAFIIFVLGGQAYVVVGYFRNWRWVRNLTFRVSHILAIGIVAVLAWVNQICPLTVWESNLRDAAGEQTYQGSFIEHWIGRLVYYDAPQWVFTVTYSLFGALVFYTWIWIRPEKDTPSRPAGSDI